VPEGFDALEVDHQEQPRQGQAVQLQLAGHPLGDGHAAGFNQHMRRGLLSPGQLQQGRTQAIAQGAAHAATAQLEHRAIGLAQALGVDVDAAQVVDQQGPALVIRLLQPPVDQGGLARAQVATHHRGRHPAQARQRRTHLRDVAHAWAPSREP
jgi:hypothetical protein